MSISLLNFDRIPNLRLISQWVSVNPMGLVGRVDRPMGDSKAEESQAGTLRVDVLACNAREGPRLRFPHLSKASIQRMLVMERSWKEKDMTGSRMVSCGIET